MRANWHPASESRLPCWWTDRDLAERELARGGSGNRPQVAVAAGRVAEGVSQVKRADGTEALEQLGAGGRGAPALPASWPIPSTRTAA